MLVVLANKGLILLHLTLQRVLIKWLETLSNKINNLATAIPQKIQTKYVDGVNKKRQIYSLLFLTQQLIGEQIPPITFMIIFEKTI